MPGSTSVRSGSTPAAAARASAAPSSATTSATHVAVARVRLHRARLAPHVHEHERRARGGDRRAEPRVEAQRRDVVDDRRARLERGARDGGLGRVDADRHRAARRERPHDRHHPPQLLLERDRRGAGAGGLAADVEDVRALRREAQPVFHGGAGVEEGAAVREGVRGHVDDAHDRCAPAEGELVRPRAQGEPPPAHGPHASRRRAAATRPHAPCRAGRVSRRFTRGAAPPAAPPAAARRHGPRR